MVSHWAKEAHNATELGELGAEAAALAKTGRICTVVAPTNCHWDEANPPPVFSAPLQRQKTSAEAIAHAATMLKNGKKTGLVLGNLAMHGDALDLAARIGAKTGASFAMRNFSLLSPFARRRASACRPDPLRIRSQPSSFCKPLPADDFCRRAVSGRHVRLQEQANDEEPAWMRSFHPMSSVEQDLTAALRSLVDAAGATDTAAFRQPRTEATAPSGELTARSNRSGRRSAC